MLDHAMTIAVFAKPPVAGEVKTRLIPVLGAKGAAKLAEAFLVDALGLIRSLQWARPVIATTGELRPERFGHDLTAVTLWDQGAGDLGARIERIMMRGLSEGAHAVIALGADSPAVTSQMLETAKEALLAHHAVLGPSHDGGYYLIGLRQCSQGLLSEIPWSVPETFEATRARLLAAGLSLSIVEMSYDVDTPEDLEILERDIVEKRINAPATTTTLRDLGRIP